MTYDAVALDAREGVLAARSKARKVDGRDLPALVCDKPSTAPEAAPDALDNSRVALLGGPDIEPRLERYLDVHGRTLLCAAKDVHNTLVLGVVLGAPADSLELQHG